MSNFGLLVSGVLVLWCPIRSMRGRGLCLLKEDDDFCRTSSACHRSFLCRLCCLKNSDGPSPFQGRDICEGGDCAICKTMTHHPLSGKRCMRGRGFEPLRETPLDPKSSASASSATLAFSAFFSHKRTNGENQIFNCKFCVHIIFNSVFYLHCFFNLSDIYIINNFT